MESVKELLGHASITTTIAATVATSVATSITAAFAAGVEASLVPGGIEAGALFANDRLRFDGVHFRLVEMVRAGDEHAEELIAELHVALECGDGRARSFEEGHDVGAALLALDLVGELALVPLLDDEDLSAVAFDHAAAERDAGIPGCRSGRAEEKHRFV